MKEAEAIAKLALENLELKEKVKTLLETLNSVNLTLVCIGGPFNDNIFCFNKEQLKYLRPILEETDAVLSDFSQSEDL